jgi:HNH endonuclease
LKTQPFRIILGGQWQLSEWRNVLSTDDENKQQFLQMVRKDPDSDCLMWIGQAGMTGRGRFKINGRIEETHRVAYRLWVGPIPEGMQINHLCGNGWCVRPSHLYAGTHQENMRDREETGATFRPKGELHPRASLTDDQARVALRMVDGGDPTWFVAQKLGFPTQTIINIVGGKRYAHVEGPRRPIKPPPSSSRFRGVSFRKGRWEVAVNAPWGKVYCGRFVTEEQAAAAYNSYVCDQWLDKPLNVINPLPDRRDGA